MKLLRALPLILALALAACGGGDEAPPASFAPLTYGYLTKLRLNVGDIEVKNATQNLGDNDVSAQSPEPPEQAMEQMAHDRLFAAGTSGTAVFTIDQASILRGDGGVLSGTLAAHLDILTPGGTRAGFAEMQVSRQYSPGSDDENRQTVLYTMTKQMMDDMNVELEYELKKSLRDWLVPTSAAPAPVSEQPLAPPTGVPGGLGIPPAAAPPEAPPPESAPPGTQMSPPPGFLHLPGALSPGD